MEFILASTSPRRRELVTLLGIPFRALSLDVDETRLPDESPAAMVERLALAKARAGQKEFPDALIIAADTTVAFESHLLGKPRDADEATRMLKLLRGQAHVVYSGLAIVENKHEWARVVTTTVWMRDYSDDEIAAYVASGNPFDKAAAYAVQHDRFKPVARVEGCFANVMGLPLCLLAEALNEFGQPARTSIGCVAHPERECSIPRLLNV